MFADRLHTYDLASGQDRRDILKKLVFWRSLRKSENPVLRTLAYLNHNNFVGTASKYGFDNYMVNVVYCLAELLRFSFVNMCV